MILSLM